MSRSTRRGFLRQTSAGGSLLAFGGASLIQGLRPVSAEEADVRSEIVQFQPDIEPLVRLLEDTPRERVIEEVALRVKHGLSYRELLAALLLAGVRNVQPRPAVGFKFHAVLVVNSAHLASLAAPATDRWLPIFWAIDAFKGSQAADVKEGNWTMAPVAEARVPSVVMQEQAFTRAMDEWDEEGADVAIAGLARTRGANRLFDLFARFGARDFRSIGHKAIFVANSFRTLQTIGWQYAEPVLRSLAYALLNHEGEPNPSQSDLEADRAWRWNRELIPTIREGWQQGRLDDGATRDLLNAFRTETPESINRQMVAMLNAEVSPQSLFDAMFLAAGEMLMRQPGIVSLHASTTTNAMRYAFDTVASEETRKLLLLQNAAFLPMFREAMRARGAVGDMAIDDMTAGDAKPAEEIFTQLNANRAAGAAQLLGSLDAGMSPVEAMQVARQLIFLKGNDSHDYKFSSAVMEDYYRISPAWRNRFFAASAYKLRGADETTNGLIERIQQAIS